jgi:hypothetical protein
VLFAVPSAAGASQRYGPQTTANTMLRLVENRLSLFMGCSSPQTVRRAIQQAYQTPAHRPRVARDMKSLPISIGG